MVHSKMLVQYKSSAICIYRYNAYVSIPVTSNMNTSRKIHALFHSHTKTNATYLNTNCMLSLFVIFMYASVQERDK